MNPSNLMLPGSSDSPRSVLSKCASHQVALRWLAAAALTALCAFLPACSGAGAPVPSIAGITPNTVPAGGPALPVVISGSGFASSVVQVNGQPVPVTSVTSTEVDATIPAAMTVTPGTDSVVVVNILPSGGVTSNSVAVTVTSPTAPQLAISATSSPATFEPGGTGSYTITVSNTGSEATSGTITMAASLASSETPGSIDGGSEWVCDLSSVTCTTTISLAPGQSFNNITLDVVISPDASGSITATFTASGDGSIATTSVTNPS